MKVTVRISALLAALLFVSCSTMDAVDLIANATKPHNGPAAAPSQNPPPADDAAPPPPPPGAQPGPQGAKPGPQGGPAGGMDAAAKAEMDKYSNAPMSSKVYPAGADQAGLQSGTVKAGEWAIYRSIESGKVKAIIKMAIIGKEGDAWIYEFGSLQPGESAAIQEAVQGLDDIVQSGSADKGKVLWVKVKDHDGKIQTLDAAMLGMGGAAYKNMLTANAARYAAGITPGGSVTVPAGTFSATWKVQSQVSRGRQPGQGTGWVSSQVPLWHLIKAVSDDGKTTLELVDFGTSGFKSAFN
jgi:hypothetical protein